MIVRGVDSKGTVVCIMNSLRELEMENPKRRKEDVAVIMSRPLYERLNLEIFGVRHLPNGTVARIADAVIRIMEGAEEEWYITAAHGFTPSWRFDEGETVKMPPIKINRKMDEERGKDVL